MKNKPSFSPAAAELRRRAEQCLREQHPETVPARSDADTQRLLHELQVHQIELEMQNEELQKTRDQVEAGLEKYSDLYEFAPVAYVTLDREGTIREANLTCAGLLGIERSRLVTRRFGHWVSATGWPAFTAFLKRVFESKNREFCEVTLLREGDPPVEIRIEAAAAASGRECRAVLNDITEQKRIEEERLILKKLESTGVLAGGIAHDFNNLLTVILLNLELAQKVNPSEEQLIQPLEEARRAALLARDLSHQLIIVAHGGPPIRKATCLSGLIQQSVRLALSGSRVRCELFLAADLWLAKVDERQIGQVIRNMVLNAREAMPQDGVVSVRTENLVLRSGEKGSLLPGDYVQVSIADRGRGIAKEVLPRIFDPYFSTKQRGVQKGMGLGLTICHAAVQRHGGSIVVESEVGVGTTFRIRLPANKSCRPNLS